MKRLHILSLVFLSCLVAESSVYSMKKQEGPQDEKKEQDHEIDDVRRLQAERYRAHLERLQREQKEQEQQEKKEEEKKESTSYEEQKKEKESTPPTNVQPDVLDQQEQERRRIQSEKAREFNRQMAAQKAEQARLEAEQRQKELEQRQREEQARLILEQRVKIASIDIDAVLAVVRQLDYDETLKHMATISDAIFKQLTNILNALKTLQEDKEIKALLEEKNPIITQLMNNLKQVVMELIAQVNQNDCLSVNMIADKQKIQQFEALCNQISIVGGDKSSVSVQIAPNTDNDDVMAEQLHQESAAEQLADDSAYAKALDQQLNGGHVQPAPTPYLSFNDSKYNEVKHDEKDEKEDEDLKLAYELSRQEHDRGEKMAPSSSSSSSIASRETDEDIARRLQEDEYKQPVLPSSVLFGSGPKKTSNTSPTPTTSSSTMTSALPALAASTAATLSSINDNGLSSASTASSSPSTTTATTRGGSSLVQGLWNWFTGKKN